MCGIIGFLGLQPAAPVILDGLKHLEYRGYDSAGLATLEDRGIVEIKASGKLANLEQRLRQVSLNATIGIGHTRWATHGKPSDANAHPHLDCTGRFAVVHNGIIENYQEIKEWLLSRGHRFKSETDSEVLSHLVEEFYRGELLPAVRAAVARLKGAYAFVVLCRDNPDLLVGVKKDSPLVVGLLDREYFLASDIPAFLEHTRRAYIINDGEYVIVKPEGVTVIDSAGREVAKEVLQINWDAAAAAKGGYAHFMEKEIYEQPQALKKTIMPRLELEGGTVNLPETGLNVKNLAHIRQVYIVACGTAYHAGLVGKKVIEALAGLPVETDIASEFRYREPRMDNGTLVIVVSQSGETADTLAALREAQRHGAPVVAITNVVGSSISREADHTLYTWAGPEIAVASTKAYVTQLAAMYLLGLYLGRLRGVLDRALEQELVEALKELPDKVEEVLARGAEQTQAWAQQIRSSEHAFFIGRGLDHALAMEGALKLKEISYIHAEAYAAGELKHGTLALIEDDTPVFALGTQSHLLDKLTSNIKEVKARGARVFGITPAGSVQLAREADSVLYLPVTHPLIMPVLAVVPMQLLAYHASLCRGCDVDQPRNLAKSVTVE